MKADLKTVIFERRGPIADVTLNRPQARNAYDATMQGELRAVWREVRGNPEIWVAVLNGAGHDAFCAGRDVKALAEFPHRADIEPRHHTIGKAPCTESVHPSE